MRKPKSDKKKKKFIIEIKSNRNGWYRVQLIDILDNGRIRIKLPSGEEVNRKINKGVKWGKVIKQDSGRSNKKELRYLRSKRKRNRGRKVNRPKRILSDKWK